MAWGWGESEEAHRRVYGGQTHESNWTHKLVAGAVSFASIKVWEDHQRGKSTRGFIILKSFSDHEQASLTTTRTPYHEQAGLPATSPPRNPSVPSLLAQVAEIFENKGMDEIDKIRATEHAKQNAHEVYDEHYVRGHGADQYDPSRYGHHESFNRW